MIVFLSLFWTVIHVEHKFKVNFGIEQLFIIILHFTAEQSRLPNRGRLVGYDRFVHQVPQCFF